MGTVPTIPLAKLLYSAILIGLIGLFARELVILWSSKRLYLGAFEYFSNGKLDEAASKSMPLLIAGQHKILRAALIEERRRRNLEFPLLYSSAEVYKGIPTGLPEIAQW